MNNNPFLPEGYQVPKSGGNYMKLSEGVNRIRIITNPIVGWLYWTEQDGKRKPVRLKEAPEVVPAEAIEDKFGRVMSHFWALGVYNYQEKAVQILEITQATIQDRITDLSEDEDWGLPQNYDLKIKKWKEGDRTKYSVDAAPKKELDMEVANAIAAKPMQLNALFSSADPFDTAWVDADSIK